MMDPASLNHYLEKAALGDRAAVKKFYELLPSQTFYVLDRHQTQPMSDAPRYPNDFFSLLAVQDKERVVIPVFTASEAIEEWSGQKLLNKPLPASELFSRAPEEWWIVINPGADAEKELSPWEIERLRGGHIDEILADLEEADTPQPVEIKPIAEHELKELKADLIDYAKTAPALTRLYLLREIGLDSDEKQVETILVGGEAVGVTVAKLELLRKDLQAVAQRAQIGRERVRILVGAAKDTLLLGPFKQIEPFYSIDMRRSWRELFWFGRGKRA